MTTFESSYSVHTSGPFDFADITDAVAEAVTASSIKNGRVTMFSSSNGCSLLANERESGLLKDVKRAVAKLETVGASKAGGGRGALHVGAASIVIPVVDGSLRLGTWQRLLLVELEDASDRKVLIQVVGE